MFCNLVLLMMIRYFWAEVNGCAAMQNRKTGEMSGTVGALWRQNPSFVELTSFEVKFLWILAIAMLAFFPNPQYS